MKAVFDTSILIDYLSGVESARIEIARYTDRAVSVVTWMETLVGARDAEEEDVIEMFLRDFELVPITRSIARDAVALRKARRLRLPAALTWASARSEKALLVTRNTKDFPADDPGVRVPY